MASIAKSANRTASREARRQQLIDATVKCIARKGMGGTTLADVAGEAGLSQGIVNLHFESKENLLNETLRYLADEYRTQFDKALATSGRVLPTGCALLWNWTCALLSVTGAKSRFGSRFGVK